MSKPSEGAVHPLPVHLTAPRLSSIRPDSATDGLRYHCPSNRWPGILTGGAFAICLLATIFLSDHTVRPSPRTVAVMFQEATIDPLEMPPLEPDQPEEVVDLVEEAAPQLAPPSLLDVPTVVPLNAFTQPLAPPPPPGIAIGKDTLTIPVGRPGSGFGQGIGNLFNIDNLDQRPLVKVKISPEYPPEMLRTSHAGEVRVEFIIDTRGNVIEVEVLASSHPAFESSAVRAVQRWKFKPGRKGGRAVNTRVSQIITFNLEGIQDQAVMH